MRQQARGGQVRRKRNEELDAELDEFEASFRESTDDPLTDAVRMARRRARAGRLAEDAAYQDAFNED